MNTPYTYLIEWPELNRRYYGVRYAKGCHPDDLWVTYFTSSEIVAEFVKEHGDPPIKQVRQTFNNRPDPVLAAKQWEIRVLQSLKVVERDDWLNDNDRMAPPILWGDSNPMKDPTIVAKLSGDNHWRRLPAGHKAALKAQRKEERLNDLSEQMKGNRNPMKDPKVAEKFSGSNHWFNNNPEGLKNFCGDNSPLKKDPKLAKAQANRMKKNNPMKDPKVIARILKRNAEKKLLKEEPK